MKIQVKIIGYFIYQTGFNEKILDLPHSITAGELLSCINIKKQLPRIMMRNGKGIGPDEKLKDRDKIVIAPLAGGG